MRTLSSVLRIVPFTMMAPMQANAHTDSVSEGFLGGFAHPILGPDHVVAMVAVGLWGALLGPPAIFLLRSSLSTCRYRARKLPSPYPRWCSDQWWQWLPGRRFGSLLLPSAYSRFSMVTHMVSSFLPTAMRRPTSQASLSLPAFCI